MIKFTIGSDPEVFFQNNDGSFMSAIGKIGGTKKEPLQLLHLPKGFCVQEDGVAVEFNIPPANTSDAFAQNIQIMVTHLEQKAKDLNVRLSITPSARFGWPDLQHPNAQQFGCDPDFNAWRNGEENPKPKCDDPLLRTAGGHIHVGTELPTIMCVRAHDLFLGAPSLIFDKDHRRRKLYGNAGAHRETEFGHEYRVLSNFWISHTKLVKWVYSRIIKSLEFVNGAVIMGIAAKDFLRSDEDLITRTINENDLQRLDRLNLKYRILEDLPGVSSVYADS